MPRFVLLTDSALLGLFSPTAVPTIAASAIAVLHGASYIRTHDIKDVRRPWEVAANVQEQTKKKNQQKGQPLHSLGYS